MSLNADGSLKDDNYIFDHSLNVMVGNNIDNYFSSVLRYIGVNDGSWNLSGNTVTLDLKTKSFHRLIWKDIFEKLQKTKSFREIEAELFKVYSSGKDEKIELTFNKFIKNGFILSQNLNGRTYESTCLNKNESKHSYLEAYKEIHKIK